jgi:hypothetical protein
MRSRNKRNKKLAMKFGSTNTNMIHNFTGTKTKIYPQSKIVAEINTQRCFYSTKSPRNLILNKKAFY